ncbi:MAG: SH3 domain-containing protein [Pseudomonadota bacterium]
MQLSAIIAGAPLILTMLTPLAVQAALPTQPPRWVLVDDLRVREGPGSERKVTGTLARGAELILKATTEVDGFCLVKGEGHYGYVACKYLSADRIARPRAGEDGVDAAQRWVSGNAVILREAPRPDAAVAGRLALNATVKLLGEQSGTGYCEVQPASSPSGYTACRYLASTPVILSHIRGYRMADETPSPDYDPERAFWLEPGWRALEQYAEYLKGSHPPQGPWPRNEALEKMKAHLALGLKGRKPEPWPDWLELKKREVRQSGEARRLQAEGKKATDMFLGREEPMPNLIVNSGVAEHIVSLVRALEFPSIRPSLFRSEAELAPPNTTAEEASGRFGIVYRQLVTPRPKPKPGSEDGSNAGLYDMLAHTQVLVRPVQRVQLLRDGRWRAESSLIREKEILWRDVDEPMCEGWAPGFRFGDADTRIWRYFSGETSPEAMPQTIRQDSLKRNPAGSLYAFYTNIDLPPGPAIRTETQMKLNREDTGFVRGTHLHYDLDGDGIPDLSVWEGEGKGPGHLGGETTTDDRWYRLVLVNIGGAWKVLGSDEFSYGCGC